MNFSRYFQFGRRRFGQWTFWDSFMPANLVTDHVVTAIVDIGTLVISSFNIFQVFYIFLHYPSGFRLQINIQCSK